MTGLEVHFEDLALAAGDALDFPDLLAFDLRAGGLDREVAGRRVGRDDFELVGRLADVARVEDNRAGARRRLGRLDAPLVGRDVDGAPRAALSLPS